MYGAETPVLIYIIILSEPSASRVLRVSESWAFPLYHLHNNNIIIHYETTDNSSEQLSRRLLDTTSTEMEKYHIILYCILLATTLIPGELFQWIRSAVDLRSH